MSLIKLHVFIIFVVTLLACQEEPQKREIYSKDVENQTQELVRTITVKNCVHERKIGSAGRVSQQYIAYKSLTIIASDSVLNELTKSKNAVVRVYGFKGLLEKNAQKYIEEAKLRLVNDTALVCYFSGCEKSNLKVQQLIPILEEINSSLQ